MGIKTKIDWCDASWNPVTGCLHGCPYCYARRIAERFGGAYYEDELPNRWGEYECECLHADGDIHELDYPLRNCGNNKIAPYPFEFDPTLHRYKLDEPQHWKKPRTIFVCSMADLFGEWVPDEWIEHVFKACEATPQHRYLFLTKNPKRYVDLYAKNILPIGKGYWYGTTVTSPKQPFFYSRVPDDNPHTFVSIEPIMGSFGKIKDLPDWVIVGAETGNRKGKVAPRKEWIDEIAYECKRCRTPIFMKESLRDLMGADFRQEFPWEV
uniref:DUF5131 family protein n=1 Tax=Siphoviridae sp. ctrvp54 TaxID=2825690 RepID=A0A8S5P8U8_9CAUD|nr:MAG TPA: Protein of unknown function (DUF5131) [Siphoviridae sp. ctrvp54]